MLGVLLQSTVGAGIITISVFALLSLCICYCGAKTKSPGTYVFLSVVLLAGIVLFFVYWPKEPEDDRVETAEDSTYLHRFVFYLFLVVGTITSLCCYVKQFCGRQIQGRRVRYD